MRLRVLLLLFACCLAGNLFAHDDDNAFTLYLVRHAEKLADGSRDPELTQAGKLRSEKLAGWLHDKNITDVWSSDYTRTRGTAEPFASEHDIDLTIYNPRDLAALAGQLRSKRHNAYVVGHSNTTPELARLLCQCTIAGMEESEYDRLIVISVNGNETNVKTVQQKSLFQP